MISYRFEAKGESNPFSFTSFKNCWSTCWDGLVNKLASGWLQGIQSKNSKNWRHGESVALQVEFSSTQMPTSPEARCCDGRASEMFREKHCVRLQAWHKSNLRIADFANLFFFCILKFHLPNGTNGTLDLSYLMWRSHCAPQRQCEHHHRHESLLGSHSTLQLSAAEQAFKGRKASPWYQCCIFVSVSQWWKSYLKF